MIILDTSYLVALKNQKDVNFSKANQLQQELIKKTYGKLLTTDYIFNEFVTFLRKKLHNPDEAVRLGEDLLYDKEILILGIAKLNFKESWELFKKYPKISFTDATTVIIAQRLKIEYVCSFDGDFDAFKNIKRIC